MAKKLALFFLAGFAFLTPKAVALTDREKTTIVNRIDLPAKASVAVSAHIGGYLFDIEGLTSPWARVDFYSTEGNIEVTTIAGEKGIFHFYSVLAPLQTGDFCFLSYDTNNVVNNPLCFSPPPPQTRTIISGIILSPSLSLDKSLVKQSDPLEAKGKTFPQASIKVFLFEEERSWWREFIDVVIPAALAREGPKLVFSADQGGNFSFNLPTQKSTKWRFFVGPQLEDQNLAAKSNTLEFSTLSWWQWFFLKAFRWLSSFLKQFFNFLLHWQTMTLLLIIAILAVWLKMRKDSRLLEKKRTDLL